MNEKNLIFLFGILVVLEGVEVGFAARGHLKTKDKMRVWWGMQLATTFSRDKKYLQ